MNLNSITYRLMCEQVDKEILKTRVRLKFVSENFGIRKALQVQKELQLLLDVRYLYEGGKNARI